MELILSLSLNDFVVTDQFFWQYHISLYSLHFCIRTFTFVCSCVCVHPCVCVCVCVCMCVTACVHVYCDPSIPKKPFYITMVTGGIFVNS